MVVWGAGMSRFKWAVFVASIASIVTPGCMIESDSESFQMDGSIYRIEIETKSGDIYLNGGANTEVQVESLLSWSGRRPEVSSEFHGGVLKLRSTCVERAEGTCAIDINVALPAEVAVWVRTEAGDLHVRGMSETIEFLSATGRIHRSAS